MTNNRYTRKSSRYNKFYMIIALFFSPFASHCAREYFAYNKPYFKIQHNITDEKLALYDSTFMITYSCSLLINGYISNVLKVDKLKIIHLNIALVGSSLSFLVFTYYFDILIWLLHAFFTAALWPISFSLSIQYIDNNFIKCLWTLNGPCGDYLATFISCKYNYLIPLIYSLCFALNIFFSSIKHDFVLCKTCKRCKRCKIENCCIRNDENIDNIENGDNREHRQEINNFVDYFNFSDFPLLTNFNGSSSSLTSISSYRSISKIFKNSIFKNSIFKNKYFKLLNLILISFYIKTITYSTSNWLPSVNKELYNYYSLFTIFGTLLIGIKTLYIKKFNIVLIFLCYILFLLYIIQSFVPIVKYWFVYGLIGILQSEISTLISILICEKNKDLVNGLALMTSIMDFSGTIGNALMQLIVFTNLELYLTIFSGLLALFVTIIHEE